MAVALEGEDMGGDAVQEPAVVRDHEGVAGELQQRIFQRAQGFDVEVVGRLVEQQHVAALQQRLRQVQAAALAAGQRADQLLLVLALEVEAADVGTRLNFDAVDIGMSAPPKFPGTRCGCRQASRTLVDVGSLTVGPS